MIRPLVPGPLSLVRPILKMVDVKNPGRHNTGHEESEESERKAHHDQDRKERAPEKAAADPGAVPGAPGRHPGQVRPLAVLS